MCPYEHFYATREKRTMPLGEIAGEALGGLVRIVGQFFAEIVFEVLIKGTGYLIVRPFIPTVDPDGALVVTIGIAFWVSLGGLGLVLYRVLVA